MTKREARSNVARDGARGCREREKSRLQGRNKVAEPVVPVDTNF